MRSQVPLLVQKQCLESIDFGSGASSAIDDASIIALVSSLTKNKELKEIVSFHAEDSTTRGWPLIQLFPAHSYPITH